MGGVSEYQNLTFRLSRDITRAMMVAILYRYAQFKNKDVSKTSSIEKYLDAETVSSYAVDALKWACEQGIVQGFEDNTIRPQENISRAQMAMIVFRYLR